MWCYREDGGGASVRDTCCVIGRMGESPVVGPPPAFPTPLEYAEIKRSELLPCLRYLSNGYWPRLCWFNTFPLRCWFVNFEEEADFEPGIFERLGLPAGFMHRCELYPDLDLAWRLGCGSWLTAHCGSPLAQGPAPEAKLFTPAVHSSGNSFHSGDIRDNADGSCGLTTWFLLVNSSQRERV